MYRPKALLSLLLKLSRASAKFLVSIRVHFPLVETTISKLFLHVAKQTAFLAQIMSCSLRELDRSTCQSLI